MTLAPVSTEALTPLVVVSPLKPNTHERSYSMFRVRFASAVAPVLGLALILGGPTVKAGSPLSATPENLKKLQAAAYLPFCSSPSTWYYPYSTASDKALPMQSALPYKCLNVSKTESLTKLDSGDCVAGVKALSNSTKGPSGYWKAGAKLVVGGKINTALQPGQVVATFDANGNYINGGHAMIFAQRISDTEIKVYDQNWLDDLVNKTDHIIGAVGTHRMTTSKSTALVINLENYSVVTTP